MMRALFVVLSLFAASALSTAGAAESCDQRCKVQQLIDQNVGIPFDRPLTLEIMRKFAPLLKETKEPVPEYVGVMKCQFEYTGLVVTVIVRPDNSMLVWTIALTGGNYRMAHGIKLGKITGPDINTILGPPMETRRDDGKPLQWVYTNLEQTEVVNIDRTETEILAVHWDFTPGD